MYKKGVDVSRIGGRDAVELWYGEEKLYKYDGQFSKSAGHFTQIVWKKTQQIGVAIVGNSARGSYVVVDYYPRGNVIGSFFQNVPKISKDSVKCRAKK